MSCFAARLVRTFFTLVVAEKLRDRGRQAHRNESPAVARRDPYALVKLGDMAARIREDEKRRIVCWHANSMLGGRGLDVGRGSRRSNRREPIIFLLVIIARTPVCIKFISHWLSGQPVVSAIALSIAFFDHRAVRGTAPEPVVHRLSNVKSSTTAECARQALATAERFSSEVRSPSTHIAPAHCDERVRVALRRHERRFSFANRCESFAECALSKLQASGPKTLFQCA